MQLTHLTDEELDQRLIQLVRSEREVLIEILHHLREVDARRLHSKFKLPSLFDYATKRLGYSEDQAIRRISAMRLLKEVPAIEKKIEDGRLTLTHLTKAESVFRKEKKAQRERTVEQKLDLLSHLELSSMKQTDQTLQEEAFVEIKSRVQAVTLESFEEPLRKKLQRLLDVKSHAHPDLDVVGLINLLADLGLEKWDKLKKAERAAAKQNDAAVPALIKVKIEDTRVESARRPYFPAAVRHTVYLKYGGVCSQCGSGRNVEVDHIVPVALGGSSAIENLRLLCRICNQRAAIDRFGQRKMSSFLRNRAVVYRAG